MRQAYQLEPGSSQDLETPSIAVLIPCYNEEDVLIETAARISTVLRSMIKRRMILEDSHIIFVDDGSRDAT